MSITHGTHSLYLHSFCIAQHNRLDSRCNCSYIITNPKPQLKWFFHHLFTLKWFQTCMIFLLNIKNIFWRLLVTKHLLVPIEYHSTGKTLWRSMGKLFGYQQSSHISSFVFSRNSYRFGTTRGWANDDRIVIIGWTCVNTGFWSEHETARAESLYTTAVWAAETVQSNQSELHSMEELSDRRLVVIPFTLTADLPDLTSAIKITHL